MKITFACTGCGRTLKARPNSVGRTRKCPVCATRVTCPAPSLRAEPVRAEPLDAEIVEAEVIAAPPRVVPAARPAAAAVAEPAPAFNPFADVDDDPYQLAEPDPVTTSPPESKRPCPMCGEMILSEAVKCRFCGEVFDPKLKKGKSRKTRKSSGGGGSSSTGARDIGIGILCMGAGIGLTIASFAHATDDGKGGGHFVVFYGLVLGGFIQMCRGVYGLVTSG
jgi:predicted RNA-binding Zn-ribbon protein involved in translation (DUF1610 family)